MAAIPFVVQIRPGQPIYEQIVYAVRKAVAQGVLKPGDRFPAVRALSQYLKVTPNTVQKAVADLTARGILEIRPGLGSFVAPRTRLRRVDIRRILRPLTENLIIEATELGLGKEDLMASVAEHWHDLAASKQEEGSAGAKGARYEQRD